MARLNVKGKSKWTVTRIANGAPYFFSVSKRQRLFMRRQLLKHEISSAGDVQRILQIQDWAWSKFMLKAGTGELVRAFGGIEWNQAQRPDPQEARDQEEDNRYETRRGRSQVTNETEILKQRVRELESRIRDYSQSTKGPLTIHVRRYQENGRKKVIATDMAHVQLPALLKRVAARVNVYLVGPAGSGKTKAAEQVAELLELEFGAISVGMQTTKADIFGFISATGSVVRTQFRERYEHGGVFLIDEIDAGNAGVLTSLNAALAGDQCAFPDGMIQRHPDFICIAAGNTYGTGPDRVYVGRQQLDGASLNRFDFLEWAYDEGLELEISKLFWTDNEEQVEQWVKFVQSARAAVRKCGIRHVISPRQSINGVKLLQQEVDVDEVKQTQVWQSMKPAEVERVLATMSGTD